MDTQDNLSVPSAPLPPPPAAPAMQLQGFGTVFTEAWNMYKKLFGVLFSLALIIFVASSLPVAGEYVFRTNPILGSLFGLFYLVAVVLAGIAGIATIIVVASDGTETVGSALGRGLRLLVSYFWVSILMTLAVMGGYLLLIVPGIIMSVMLLFSTYVLVAEGKKGLSALAQSWYYVKGHGWDVFVRLFVFGLVIILIYFVIGLLVGGLAGLQSTTTVTGQQVNLPQSLAVNLVLTLIQPFIVVFFFLTYKELRQMKGEVDEATLHSNRQKLMWLSLLGILAGIVFISLIGFSFYYLYRLQGSPFTPFSPAGTSSGLWFSK